MVIHFIIHYFITMTTYKKYTIFFIVETNY
jgi:hypothetical protein